MTNTFTKPRPIALFCTVSSEKTSTHFVGFAKDIDAARERIADDLRGMQNTFGGLIAPEPISNRNYRAFRAEWTEIEIGKA